MDQGQKEQQLWGASRPTGQQRGHNPITRHARTVASGHVGNPLTIPAVARRLSCSIVARILDDGTQRTPDAEWDPA